MPGGAWCAFLRSCGRRGRHRGRSGRDSSCRGCWNRGPFACDQRNTVAELDRPPPAPAISSPATLCPSGSRVRPISARIARGSRLRVGMMPGSTGVAHRARSTRSDRPDSVGFARPKPYRINHGQLVPDDADHGFTAMRSMPSAVEAGDGGRNAEAQPRDARRRRSARSSPRLVHRSPRRQQDKATLAGRQDQPLCIRQSAWHVMISRLDDAPLLAG